MAESRRIIKFMDIADVARIEKGETIGGKLGTPLSVDLEWSEANNFLVDLNEDKYADVSDEFIDVLLEVDKDRFKDVTGMQRIPSNKFQTTFRAAPATEARETGQESAAKPEVSPDADEPKVATGGSVAGGAGPRGATRGGGSTRGGI